MKTLHALAAVAVSLAAVTPTVAAEPGEAIHQRGPGTTCEAQGHLQRTGTDYRATVERAPERPLAQQQGDGVVPDRRAYDPQHRARGDS